MAAKWPKQIKHRGKVLATIYRPGSYPLWRVAYTVEGKRRFKPFPKYSGEGGALAWAEELVKDLAKHSKARVLTESEAGDALSALNRLQRFYEDTGTRYSLFSAANELCDALGKVPKGHTIGDAITGFATTVITVNRMDLAQAVKDFNLSREHLGESKNGERSKRSPVYIYNTGMWLEEFAGAFPGQAVCDLTKAHLDQWITKFKDLSPKSRNDRRAIVKMFLAWTVRKDYLAVNHRLLESTALDLEDKDTGKIDCYTVKELRGMLEAASPELLPVVALGGLAGLRREEIMRLKWANVFAFRGQIDITGEIAKGRNRRLVPIVPALAQWLNDYRKQDGAAQVWSKSPDALEEQMTKLRDSIGIKAKKNGLRHGFVSCHMALHNDENLTAAISGNSPQMIHEHYRKPIPKAEARAWFAVAPKRAANVVTLRKGVSNGAA